MFKFVVMFAICVMACHANVITYYYVGEGQYFYLKNVGSGQCAVAENDGIIDMTRVVQWPCVTGATVQKGRVVEFIKRDGNGAYQIRNLLSGKCYVVHLASIENGFGIDEYTCDQDLANSRWLIKNVDATGAFMLENVGSHLFLTVQGSSTTNGAPLVQWPNNGLTDKQWRLESVVP